MTKKGRGFRPYIIVTALSSIVHAPILLMDGIYWDDWVLRQFLLDSDFSGHFLLWKELGLPGYAPIYWVIGNLGPDPAFAHNVSTFALLITIPLLVLKIARNLGLSTIEGGIVAVTASVFPALETVFVFNNTVYLLMLALFLGAVALSLKGRHAIALVLFAVSFQHSALLVFYGGFLALIAPRALRARGALQVLTPYLLLPVVFFLVTRSLFPAVSYYNSFDLGVRPLLAATMAFLDKGILEQIGDIATAVFTYPIAWVITVFIGTVIVRNTKSRLSSEHAHTVFLFGLLLLAFAIAPYAAVSKAPRAHGYTTRHALLLAIPMGILLTGYLRTLLMRGKRGIFVTTIMLATLYFGSLVSHWENYALWQGRWVKDRSIIQYFSEHPEYKRVSTFIIDDRFEVTPETYRFYEWSGMLRMAYSEPGRLGMYPHQTYGKISEIGQYHPHWKEWYHLAGYPMNDCRAIVRIEEGGDASPFTYFRHRFSFKEEGMREILRGATIMTVEPDAGTCEARLS